MERVYVRRCPECNLLAEYNTKPNYCGRCGNEFIDSEEDCNCIAQENKFNDIMEVKEAAEYLKCSPQTVRIGAKKNNIPHRYIGEKYLFSKAALSVWASGYDPEKLYEAMAEKMLEKIL